MTSTCATASMVCAATVRSVRGMRGEWRRRGRKLRREHSLLPPPFAGEGWGGGVPTRIPPPRPPRPPPPPARGGGRADKDSPSRRSAPTSPASGGGEKETLRREEKVSVGSILALAYPDRIGKNRGGGTHTFLLANGRGAHLDPASPLAREPFLA